MLMVLYGCFNKLINIFRFNNNIYTVTIISYLLSEDFYNKLMPNVKGKKDLQEFNTISKSKMILRRRGVLYTRDLQVIR